MMQSAPAGWYPDPEDPTQQRYWDGAAWTQNVAPTSPTGDALRDHVFPDSTPQPVEAPVLGTWKTSVGFSILGLVGGLVGFLLTQSLVVIPTALLGDLAGADRQTVYPFIALFTTTIVCVFAIAYAVKIYPSYFGGKPVLRSSKVISLCNFASGGPVFGALWNRNLTRRTKGVSHIVWTVLLAVWLLGVGMNAAGAVLFKPSPFAFTPSQSAIVRPADSNNEFVLKNNGVSEYYVMTIGGYNWRMLDYDKEKDAALLVAEEAIGTARFDDSSNDWQTSDMWQFLNGTFVDQISRDFGAESIAERTNPETGATEKVFLLSEEEAKRYFASSQDAVTAMDGTKLDSWWLRTPGAPADAVTVVVPGEDIGGRITRARNDNYGVRPAFWLLIPGEPGAGKGIGDGV